MLVWRALGSDILVLIVANTVSGTAVVAIAFAAWQWKERKAADRARRTIVQARASRLKVLQAELDTIVSFTEKSEMASTALEQFRSYQQWLVANNLLSWKQNRHIVQTWQQTSGSALSIRLGQVGVAPEVVEDLATDMRKTELPSPEDDHFRWQEKPVEPPTE